MEPTDLHERLHRLADRTSPPPRHDLADAVVTRHRAQRRQAFALTAVAAVVAGVVVVVPSLLSPAERASVATPVVADVPVPAEADVLSGPTRGSLAADTAFVEDVRRLTWTEADDPDAPTAEVDPPLASRRVVFAGEVAGARWALVAGTDPEREDRVAAAWFTGPAGAEAAQLQPTSLLSGTDAASPVALSDAGTGALVVVAAPGDEISLSRRPEVHADGAVSRSFDPVDAPNGVATVVLPPAAGTYDEALRYRVTRDGAEVTTAMPSTHRSVGASAADDVPVTWLRGEPGDRGPVLTGAIDHVLEITGLPAEELEFTVVWRGDVPASTADTARVDLLAATLPSGSVYLEAVLAATSADGTVASTWCATDLRAGGPALSDQVFALRCSAPFLQGTDPIESLVLIGPPAADSARLLDGAGAVLQQVGLVDGVAVLPPSVDVEGVEFLAAGQSVGSTRPLGYNGLEAIAATPGGGN
ncbi:hypothetical protein [Modestobacter roseus]|uniref:Uncharacterized protein n=1 Tax=Modestobacter roseus TaxID=1181884 RepID=A0A562INX5_9ACTN|nr:hypothetical protein [Modestobacter roseus]MQA36116.1 hypothetical protein [Modestobacter roseus]TWH72602.1 hypothetical protein JD78_01118 [Modestobacter roseus]